MATVFYNVKSNRKVVHLSHCRFVRKNANRVKGSFSSLEEANLNGYRLCNCCSRIASKYRKERLEIKEFCTKTGFEFTLVNGEACIKSRYDFWKILISRQNSIFLYHRNIDKYRPKRPSTFNVPNYHEQKIHSQTIIGYLKYIKEHDDYVEQKLTRSSKPCPAPVKTYVFPEWKQEKYGITSVDYTIGKPRKGSKKYKAQQKRMEKKNRRASIARVLTLIDELSARQV